MGYGWWRGVCLHGGIEFDVLTGLGSRLEPGGAEEKGL